MSAWAWARGRHPTDYWIHFELANLIGMREGQSAAATEEVIGGYRAAIA